MAYGEAIFEAKEHGSANGELCGWDNGLWDERCGSVLRLAADLKLAAKDLS